MAKTFTRLKVPGYTVKRVLSSDQPSFSQAGFDKLLKSTTKGSTFNDLVFVYVNAHGTQVVNETTGALGITKRSFDHSPGIPTEDGVFTWKQLLNSIGTSTKGKVFLATEVCFSGNLVNVVKKHYIKGRITIFTGASESETAHADLFTKRLATGLITRDADSKVDMNLKVTAKELYNYIMNGPSNLVALAATKVLFVQQVVRVVQIGGHPEGLWRASRVAERTLQGPLGERLSFVGRISPRGLGEQPADCTREASSLPPLRFAKW